MGRAWIVRRLTGQTSERTYTCPGCTHEIRPGTPHVVVWPDDALGSVSADSVKSALVPHHIAGAGLVLAIIGTYLRPDPPEELDP